MVVCGSYMFEFSVSNDMENTYINNKGGGSREGSSTSMSNTNCQRINN
jgi:hypothetical protein